MLKIGYKVKHRSGPDDDVGEIIEIMSKSLYNVEFSNSRFSEMPLDAIGVIKETDKEQCTNEFKSREKQAQIYNKEKPV